jgi:flagellar assembly factor FliW
MQGLDSGGRLLKVKTTRFGEIQVEAHDTVELPHGLVGFPELKTFVLLDHDKDSPFKWLQSMDDGAIAFVVINPLLFRPDYSVEVPEAEVKDLELTSEEDAVISVIITLPTDPQEMTANLKAPLVFNLKNRKGRQIILNSSNYLTRHNVLQEMKKYGKNKENQKIEETISKAKDQKSRSREVESKK